MKDYEIYSDLKIPKSSSIILRVDGRSFHNLASKIDLIKPYDENFANLMADVCEDILKEFSPSFVYTFSDEINILLNEIPFNQRLEKIDSVVASFTSSSFTLNYSNYFEKPLYKPISFDCRVIPVNKNEIAEYFKWRQDEAWRNCVNGYGIWFLKSKYSSKEANDRISGLKGKDIHEMLFNEGINLNDVENWKKRGMGFYKKQKEIAGFNKKEMTPNTTYRNYIYRDLDLPIFSDRFFNEMDII
ncbi:MAG: tRNA(His) guanylyltransferase Thg1 family protein [Methanobrevibacter sp.]|uniref:tRNA(His) guanylyltransferase Thg1 family protein n=1 Tax=Methanobrevibacter sp. TaxID=66852 RepID=UPI0026E10220|nr:tRNA(His) guanylyltransferase Thg1 family protein [Methanobrevibacter sp.]MDO5848933.1 tRNA(His) guanylyltransferase Thg1 family protein [Methanobrevibacter sp.]